MNAWGEVEFAAEEEDSGAVVFEAAEAACVGFDGLDFGVEALGEGVGDAVLEVGEQTAQMRLQGLGDLLDFRQATAHDSAIPLLEEDVADIGVGLLPELDHLLLVGLVFSLP